jgi:hypothetical protein
MSVYKITESLGGGDSSSLGCTKNSFKNATFRVAFLFSVTAFYAGNHIGSYLFNNSRHFVMLANSGVA